MPYERDAEYGNDGVTANGTLRRPMELMGFVNAIAAFPALHRHEPRRRPNASIMILRDFGPLEVCWGAHLANRGETDTLFQLLRSGLNPADTLTVSFFRRREWRGRQ